MRAATTRLILLIALLLEQLTQITISGDPAEVRVIKEGLTNASGVTKVGSSALVLVERLKAVGVPLKPF